MHELSGYVVHPTTGAAIPGATVTIIDEVTGSPVEVGGVTGGSSNPTSTDGNGYFSWTCELSPGPVQARATNGGEVKISSGKELRQVGSYYSGDIPVIIQSLSAGVIHGILEDFLGILLVLQKAISQAKNVWRIKFVQGGKGDFVSLAASLDQRKFRLAI